MGYYKKLFTPWQSVGSYEDDELKEMGRMQFRNGVLNPRDMQTHYQSSQYKSGITICHFCHVEKYCKPDLVGHPQCKECRQKSIQSYLKAVSR